ncbi:MAG: hypothetical protein QG665_197 [Patescibacteria group bacterium]|nr:hypothetical protein [Patescibacteria group bacterium]
MVTTKNPALFWLSLFSLTFGVIAIDYSIYVGNTGSAFWFCYIALVLFGLGGILCSPTLVVSQLQIIFLPVLIWLGDFLFVLSPKNSLWGISDYFFTTLTPLARLISLEHFFIIPLGLILLSLLPKPKFVWSIVISATQTVLTFLLILFFTKPTDNANCVFSSCASVVPDGPLYQLYWFGLMFAMMIISSGIFRLFYFFKKN